MAGKTFQHWVVSVSDPEKLFDLYKETFQREAGSIHTQLQDLSGIRLTDDDGYGTYTLDGICEDLPENIATALAGCIEGYYFSYSTGDMPKGNVTYFHGGEVFYQTPIGSRSPDGFDSLRYGTDGYNRMVTFAVPTKDILSRYVVKDGYGNERFQGRIEEIERSEYSFIDIRRDFVFEEMSKIFSLDDDEISPVLNRNDYSELKPVIERAISNPEKSGITSPEKYFPVCWTDKSVCLSVTPTDSTGERTADAFPVRVMINGTQSFFDAADLLDPAGDDERLALRRLLGISGIGRLNESDLAGLSFSPAVPLRCFKDNRNPDALYIIKQISPVLLEGKKLLEDLEKNAGSDSRSDYLGSLPGKNGIRENKKDRRR